MSNGRRCAADCRAGTATSTGIGPNSGWLKSKRNSCACCGNTKAAGASPSSVVCLFRACSLCRLRTSAGLRSGLPTDDDVSSFGGNVREVFDVPVACAEPPRAHARKHAVHRPNAPTCRAQNPRRANDEIAELTLGLSPSQRNKSTPNTPGWASGVRCHLGLGRCRPRVPRFTESPDSPLGEDGRRA